MTHSELHPVAAHPLSRRSLLRAGALLGGGLAAGPLFARTGTTADAALRYPAVAALLEKYVAAKTLPGAVATIGWGSAPPEAIARGVLAADSTVPVGLDSLYRIYSMTKPVTGMAAMILIDEGKLGLDQPIADILPAYARMQVQVTPDGSVTDVRPAQAPITVRHLLTHTAGLGYTITQTGPLKAAYEAAGLVPGKVSHLPIPGYDTTHQAPSLAAFADRLATMPLVYEPGTRFSYSVSLDLLGRVIELVAGTPFDAFLQERILGPCGMTSTAFRVAARDVTRLTTNYGIFGSTPVPIDLARNSVYLDPPPFPFGGAGLASTPRDYDRFLTMLLGMGTIGGRRVMSEAAVRLGMSDLLPPGADTAGTYIDCAGFGAGGRVGRGRDEGTFGWSGAAGTVGFVNTRVGLRAGLYVQYMPSAALPLQREFPEAVFRDLPPVRKAA